MILILSPLLPKLLCALSNYRGRGGRVGSHATPMDISHVWVTRAAAQEITVDPILLEVVPTASVRSRSTNMDLLALWRL